MFSTEAEHGYKGLHVEESIAHQVVPGQMRNGQDVVHLMLTFPVLS